MKKFNHLFRCEIINPYLIPLYTIIFLYAFNIDSVPLNLLIRSTIISLIIVFIAFKFLHLFIKDIAKASLILTILLSMILFYGHIFRILPFFEIIRTNNLVIGKNKVIVTIATFIFAFTAILISRLEKVPKTIIKVITYSLLILISFNLLKIFSYKQSKHLSNIQVDLEEIKAKTESLKLPDIYYIILDAHTREDVLREIYNYQDNILTPYLQKNGFYIAKSQSNYLETAKSLPSSLNMNYLEKLDSSKSPMDLINENLAAKLLKSKGYKYITFNSGVFLSEKSTIADIFYDYNFGLNRFEQLYINTTVFSKLLRSVKVDLNTFHRNRIISIFEDLKEISRNEEATFTFAHILSPHPPFIFDSDGKPTNSDKRFSLRDGATFPGTQEDYKSGYLNQLIYIDKKTVELVSEILINSSTPPIIIIQGDHGSTSLIDWNNKSELSKLTILPGKVFDPNNPLSLKERSSILSAYYFPNGGDKMLYDSISPVNTFRMLFNYYFQENYELLKDITITE